MAPLPAAAATGALATSAPSSDEKPPALRGGSAASSSSPSPSGSGSWRNDPPLDEPPFLNDPSPPEKKHSDDGSPLRPSQAPGYDQALSEQSMGMTSGIRAKRDEPYDSTRDS